MKLIYTSDDRFLVTNAKDIVEQAGIPVMLKNEYASGGVGLLPVLETWPELWVINDADYLHAKRLLDEVSAGAQMQPDWRCNQCGENNTATFELCWSCASIKPEA